MASRTKKPVKRATKPKTPAKKKPVATSKSVSQKRETLASLRAHVDEIETRLERANKATKSSVTALKSSFTKLSKKTGATESTQENDLNEQLDVLSSHLIGLIDKTRNDVAHDLQMVLDDPRMETVSAALTKANHRITTAEREQAQSLSAVHEQISTLAAIVDDRLQSESRLREKMGESLRTKIDAVEQRSAKAVRSIGDKIVTLTDDLNDRAQSRAEALKQEFSDNASEHLRALDTHKADIARRIEALEDDQRNTIPSLERRLVTIASRLETLETERYEAFEAAPPAPPPFDPVPQAEIHTPNVSAPSQADVFTPQSVQAYEPVPAPISMNAAPEVYAAPAPDMPDPSLASHVPQEFVPQEYVPAPVQQQDYAQPAFTAQEYRAPEQLETTQAYPEPSYETAPTPYDNTAAPPPFASDVPPIMPTPEQTMDAARPGGPIKKEKKSLFSLIKGGKGGGTSGGSTPIKMFALMTGVAVIGLFAAQKVMAPEPNDNQKNRQQQIATTQPAPSTQIASTQTGTVGFEGEEATPPVIESMDVVGDYSETMQAPDLEPQANGQPSSQQLTLEAAASKGDQIAQFQMGLSHLEAGRNAEAARLIRLSANQGQAAAQYRLAKLYENGIGTEKDLNTAMKLLERSAKAGNRIAMHDLGHYYATGTALEAPDIPKAVTWFHKAAERGVLDSQFNLGVLYQEGSGVSKSLVDLYVWYSIAGAQGDRMAAQRSEVIARDLNENDLDKAVARVKAFTPARINDTANGIFKDLPWAPKEKSAASNTGPNVKTAQQRLASLGYEIGSPDGAMGPRTRNAIIKFERANGLPETGRVNAELIDRLNLAVGA